MYAAAMFMPASAGDRNKNPSSLEGHLQQPNVPCGNPAADRLHMLLNHLPISFSSDRFTGHSVSYESAEALRDLRKQLERSHFCYRDGDRVLIFPYEANTETRGTMEHFDITTHFGIANALARQALLRRFEASGRNISGFSPVRFVRDENLLKGAGAEIFAVYPEYSFNVRPLAPEDQAMINGVIINFDARFFIKLSAAELHARGIPLGGLYVQMTKDDEDPRILPMFSRRLAGRVRHIIGDAAHLDDARVPQIALRDAFVEPNMASFERLGRHILGDDYGGFQEELQQRMFEVSAADRQLDRLNQMLKFSDFRGELRACAGLAVRLKGHLTTVGSGIGVGLSRKFSAPQCSLRPGGSITVPWPVDQGIITNGPFDADSFERKQARVALIFPRQFEGNVDSFAAQLRDGMPTNGRNQNFTQGMVRKFRMRGIEFIRCPVPQGQNRAQNYKSAALSAARENVDAALVVVTEDDRKLFGEDSPYLVSKATLMSQGIPAQMVRIQTIMLRNVAYSLNNIALALYAKLNGIPWTLSVQQRLVHEIIVGIGSARVGPDRLGERERLIGITTVFSGDGNYLLGNATAEVMADGYQQALLTSLKDNIAELRRRFGWQSGDKLRIIFHQSFKRYKDTEAAAVKDLVGELKDFEVEYAFVQVGDDHDWKLFEASRYRSTSFSSQKGEGVPERGQIVPLGPYAALVTLTGPRQLKTDLQGGPRPILVAIHKDSTFKSLDYIAKQVFDLTFMSWRTFMPTTRPVSIAYPSMVVRLLGDLREIPNWNPDILTTRLRESRWFL